MAIITDKALAMRRACGFSQSRGFMDTKLEPATQAPLSTQRPLALIEAQT